MNNLDKYNIILASASPRRQQFIRDLDIPFKVKLKPVDESFPNNLYKNQIPEYLAELKAIVYKDLSPKDIIVTGDTIVWHNEKALNKPENKDEAFEMISSLRNSWHEVISAFCIRTSKEIIVKSDTTKVYFEGISDEDIRYYIKQYKPFDKAGAYGIQEWIGQVSVSKIEGSYFNVMGFPTHLFYHTLKKLIENENDK